MYAAQQRHADHMYTSRAAAAVVCAADSVGGRKLSWAARGDHVAAITALVAAPDADV